MSLYPSSQIQSHSSSGNVYSFVITNGSVPFLICCSLTRRLFILDVEMRAWRGMLVQPLQDGEEIFFEVFLGGGLICFYIQDATKKNKRLHKKKHKRTCCQSRTGT